MFVGGVGGTCIDKGKVVEHFLLRQGRRGQEEVEAMDSDFRKDEKKGNEKDRRFLDFDSLELLVVE
jgi:hypothetical protein